MITFLALIGAVRVGYLLTKFCLWLDEPPRANRTVARFETDNAAESSAASVNPKTRKGDSIMINGKYHFAGRDTTGKKIIIDAAELYHGKYEIMAMRPGGREVEVMTATTEQEAAEAWGAMMERHTLKPGENLPLAGKYAKLRDDLRAALVSGRLAAEQVDDGGTCNFDAPALYLPRWNAAKVEQAAKEAGTGCYRQRMHVAMHVVFSTPQVGQARKNETAAKEMTRYLASCGYDATTYRQMD